MASRSKDRTIGTGLFRGVRTTSEPYDRDIGSVVYSASNCYLPDPGNECGIYARPGFARPTSFSSGGNPAQGVYTHTALNGTVYNFLFGNGKIWRWSTDLTSAPVDVTPTNIIVGTGKFIYCTSLADSIIVNDGVNKPWVGTNLGGTPITATVIEQQTPENVLSIGSNDVRLANTAFSYTGRAAPILGTQATFAANATGTAVGALGQIAIGTWGIILVELNSSAALVFTAAFNAGAGYATEPLAIAALPARTATRWYVGYVTVRADAGAVWIAGTDAFAGGSTGNQAQTTNYYAGEGPSYSVFGQPVIYYGAVFWIYQQVEATYARTTIGWSEPNQPTVGYQQTDYDNQWTLTQTGSDPLFSLAATNDALYYSRQLSWGAVAGAPGVNFQGTATHDIVSGNVGNTSPNTVKVFREYVYFADQNGRPYRFAVGGAPEPLWLQARGSFEAAPGARPNYVASYAWAVLEPNLNVYVCASLIVTTNDTAPSFAFIFDAVTGIYMGSWGVGGNYYDIGGVVRDAQSQPAMVWLQQTSGGLTYVWRQYRTFEATWTDNSTLPDINITLGILGYDGLETSRVTQVRAMQDGTGPTLTLQYAPAAGSSGTLARTMVTAAQTYAGRTVWELDTAVARGIQLGVTPSTATTQFRLYRIEADFAGVGIATIEDQ